MFHKLHVIIPFDIYNHNNSTIILLQSFSLALSFKIHITQMEHCNDIRNNET